ncbi:uncharacterized protein LOC141904325 [Tubulanus polymorphus]|uniref:uncharacterized protein LOC141904325 n=1 Tax=Tubulanus polymorphus TaxID=672921 RepID=UPI003DA2B838
MNAKTLHSWSGIQDGRYSKSELSHRFLHDSSFSNVKSAISETEVLIIDEISMISRHVFEQVEYVCRLVRNNDSNFGGLQVILSGDFFQLPPVPNPSCYDDGQYCFMSDVFKFHHVCILEQVVRQSDIAFIEAINAVSRGNVADKSLKYLESLNKPLPSNLNPIYLFPNNFDVEIRNRIQLDSLPGEIKIYKSSNEFGSLSAINSLSAVQNLYLKVGCPVILIKNLSSLLVNGLLGTVVLLKDHSVVVSFPSVDISYDIGYYNFSKFSCIENKTVAFRHQIPLRLAFALTVHRCQGMTLDSVAN